MEYEQVDYGRRIVTDAIAYQDVNSYHDLLSPDVLLVTHFPYPESSSDSNVQAIQRWVQLSQQRSATNAKGSMKAPTAVCSSSSKRRAKELLLQHEKQRENQRKRYEAFRRRREGHHTERTEDAEGDGAESGEEGRHAAASAAATHAGGAHGEAADDGAAARRRHLPSNTTSSKKTSSNPSGGGGGNAARLPLGVRWFREVQQGNASAGGPQRSSTVPGKASSTPTQASGTAAAVHGVSSEDSALSYGDFVDIAEGRMLVSFRLFELLHWMNTDAEVKNISQIEVELQLRKDILQEDEVLPLPPPPTTVKEQYEQLGMQYTERNQPLSCITVIWGRDYFLLKDKMYFDDGLIVTIHRTMLSIQEMVARAAPLALWNPQLQQPQQQQQRLCNRRSPAVASSPSHSRVAQGLTAAQSEQANMAVEAFYGMWTSRVNSLNTSWLLLDFSFLDAPEPSALLRLTPSSGNVHASKFPRAATDPRLAQGVFLNQSNDPSPSAAQSRSTRTLIKAKNKRGEEEAYEFNNNRNLFSVVQGDSWGGGDDEAMEGDEWGTRHGIGDNAGGAKKKGGRAGGANRAAGGAATRVQRYDASCVRISGCHLQSRMDQLVPVLRRIVANSLLTLHSLDLSQNHISTLPDLRLLPLQNLKLHGNAIADWRVVENEIAPLPFLSVLTLYGNPIAEEKEPPRPAMVIPSNSTAAKHSKSRAGTSGAHGASNPTGESAYWKKLLALLLSSPARVVPLRQVDFVTLTAQDFHVAGAHALFTSGKLEVLDQARSMSAGTSWKGKSTKATTVSTRSAA
ncbi:hypothetical protein ABL78_2212 [Leptomonas seymouri]|uniref:Leucine-rich repeat-containing protein 51 n=1 Tax=Leptomonas seymouri TaxID=5684 RepID=A0A0N1I156_LEPSE|nr:hypothetical protein ABL78_2212 [Leptomonas seymouri]|eukprot:KPI88674.1 hypothetical protein ABL78_2212 [Leptomonas seymouri]